MNRLVLLPLCLLWGCPSPEAVDADNDGYTADEDCDDTSPAINPGQDELCGNNADDNCDGKIDDTGPGAPRFYADGDSDQFGDASNSQQACVAPDGHVDNADDCNDGDAAINPNALDDQCDDIDNNCDESIDEGATQITVYADTDKDGYGDPAAPSMDCKAREGFSTDNTDCDDTLAAVFPGATETCNAIDDDCDEDVDEGLLGSGQLCPSTTCKALLAAAPASKDGDYWLEDGNGGAFEVACDMTTDGGGWTGFSGTALEDAELSAFRLEDGPAEDWTGEWTAAGEFTLEPGRKWNGNCDTVVISHVVTLPFSFDEWRGRFLTQHQGDDTAAQRWGTSFRPGVSVTPPCDGAVKFGADLEAAIKRGGEWGRAHDGTKSTSWGATALVGAATSFAWEINGISQEPLEGTTRSVMTVSQIDIWVR